MKFIQKPELTYGFCGPQLQKEIKKKLPKKDQYAGHQKNRQEMMVCERGGFTANFYVE